MKFTLTYCRVSTEEQGNGISLEEQETLLMRTIEFNKWQFMGSFNDKISGKNFKRPGWQALLQYCKMNKGKVDIILIKNYSRLGRNTLESLKNKELLNDMGIQIIAVDSPLDWNNPYSGLMEVIQMESAAAENKKRSKDVKETMWQLIADGYYCFQCPLGYSRIRIDGRKPSMAPNDKAPIVLEGFEMIAMGLPQIDVVKHFNDNGIKFTKSHILEILQNPVYAGNVVNAQHEILSAKHAPIVSEELFARVQDVLKGKKPKKRLTADDRFPLKGMLVCPHGHLLTASISIGRHGHKCSYYHCNSPSQPMGVERINAVELDKQIVELLSSIHIHQDAVSLFFDLFRYHYENEQKHIITRVAETNAAIDGIHKRIAKIKDDYLDGHITAPNYQELSSMLQSKLYEAKNSLIDSKPFDTNKYMKLSWHWLNDLPQLYLDGGSIVKKELLGSIMDGKLLISQKRISNPIFNPFIASLCNMDAALSTSDSMRPVRKMDGSPIVPYKGLIMQPLITSLDKLVAFSSKIIKAV